MTRNIIACEKVDELDMLERMYTEPSKSTDQNVAKEITMTKSEAIQVLKECCNARILDAEEKQALNLAIESLSAETDWIQCSDRLPKVGEQVLCCDSQARVFTSALTEIASNGMAFFGQHCKVIAWMPLPKPYGERRKQDV